MPAASSTRATPAHAIRRLALATLAAVALIGGVPAVAGATDSLAPAGAPHNWLPDEGWVWMHWLAFEEPELAAALGTDAAGIRRYLTDDRHRLATLARKRGWQLKPLARHLTRRFNGRVSRKRLAALRWRTERVLTQGHLAQHVLFHTFHGPGVSANAMALFGIAPEAFRAARQAGLSPDDIARRQGRDPATARAGVLARLRAEADRGVHTRSQSRAQARRMLSRQRDSLGCWMASPLPKFTNPGMEHHHAPGIPGCGGDAPAMP